MLIARRHLLIGPVFFVALMAVAPAAAQTPGVNIRLRTEHYAIGGSVSEARLREYGRALEFIYAEYEKGFAKLLDLPAKSNRSTATPAGEKRTADKSKSRKAAADDKARGEKSSDAADDDLFPVAIFSNTKEYQSETRENLGRSAEHSIGMFIPSTRMLLIADQGNSRDTFEVLYHEAFHQFLNRYVKNPPVWLNEGLAVHYGSAVPTGGGVAFTNVPSSHWKAAREAIEGKKLVPLADVVGADGSTFYSQKPVKLDGFDDARMQTVNYAEAYTLVHMLLNDVEGKKRLQNFIRDLAKDDGRNTAAITRKYFDEKTCEGLTQHWIRYVKSGPKR